ncbi:MULTISPECIES: DUF502 domain-containing protein [Methylomonas]|uniref:Uncharacterized protein n=1 Tax=Methylomonas koyamae TaxID=702114 RepID=A0A291IEY4_9GAMM|nr:MULTISPECIES: DUF502 domain-containing protein [Methylomonas]ANE54239.1 hypothetical protein AYM39_02910 [Methylomonas sp. DH-1]ATG88895.1 hypothetical protein MKLM6_0620 [Methylomonas koyamae]OAI28507.1 hypothetical protein A1356_06490 [Methylomonas koyamae]BBL56961.1 membrane protein [Methylomonas koyamae]
MKKILNHTLIGILAFIPIMVIVQIVLFVKDRLTDLFQFVYGYSDNYLVTFLLFAASFATITYVGHRVSMGRFSIIAMFEHLIERIPLLSTIYRVTKKLVNMIAGHQLQEPREVVYVEYPKEGIWVPAYVTNKTDDRYVLFVPTSPNPTSGFAVIVHESKVIKSEMSIEQVTSFIISVGADFEKVGEIAKLPK